MSTATADELHVPYLLDEPTIRRFRADGFVRLANVLSSKVLAGYESEIGELVEKWNSVKGIPPAERTIYERAFLQVTNLWACSERVRELAFSKRLARIATDLLGTRGVRMWHDQALYKEPSGGYTPWHLDQGFWPMASARSITAWIPFQPVPVEMGPLCFARGSHCKWLGSDLEINADSEKQIREAVGRKEIEEIQEPFALGDVSFHYGWTLHRAGPNTTNRMRRVYTIIYMDIDMRLAAPTNKDQQADREYWTPSTQIGEVMDDPLNPILYECG